MSSIENTRKRCIIQKLDFENGIVTNIKTKSRIRKKLRARITTEVESCLDETQASEDSPFESPVSTKSPREVKYPILVKKHTRGDESPVLLKKKKPNKEDDCDGSFETHNPVPSPSSPVFKLKAGKSGKGDELEKTLRRMTSHELFSQGNSSSCDQSSYQIEDFTQESKQSFKISSVDSAEVKSKSSGDYSVDCRTDSNKVLNISWHNDGPDPMSKWLEAKELNDSLKHVRKNYKKTSLRGRLEKLLQKQASEKLLWQHQNRRNSSLKLVVVSFWNDECIFFLRCRPIGTEADISFLVVDSEWVPNVKNVREGSVLELHPPWQKLSIKKSALSVLLNVICLEILDEVEETLAENVHLEPVPIEEFEKDPTLFINSLFSFRFSELLI